MTEYVFEIDESRADVMGSMPCKRCEEIVRCRDCCYAWRGNTECLFFDDGEKPVVVKPDGFCAWARKREQPHFLTSHLTK